MAVYRSALHSIDNAIDGYPVVHQVGKGGSGIELEIGNLPCIQSKLLEAVIGKIAGTVFSFRINVVDVIRVVNHCSVFANNRCRRLAHAERIGKNPCRHGQGCKNPPQFQLFGFGT